MSNNLNGNGVNVVSLQAGDDPAGSLAVPSWVDQSFGLVDPAGNAPDIDPGATSSTLISGDTLGAHLAADGNTAHLSRPTTLSFPPQSKADSDASLGPSAASSGSDGVLTAFAAAPAAALGDDFGRGAGAGGSASVDQFSKGGSGGGGGSHHGGGTPAPSTLTNGLGLTFVINWDSSVGSAPSGFIPGFTSAVQYFLGNFSDTAHPTTITLNAGWGEVAGSRLGFGALGESQTNINRVDFAPLQTALLSNLPAGDGPQSDPVSGTHYYWAPSAEEKALGLIANNTTLDGAVGFSSSASWNFNSTTTSSQYDFVSVAEHEISETMGRIALGGVTVSDSGVNYANSYSPFDLFRFSDVSLPAPAGGSAAYFSYNNGTDSGAANLAGNTKTYFNTTAGADYGDWANGSGNDAYNAFTGTGADATSAVDRLVMDVLGYGRIA